MNGKRLAFAVAIGMMFTAAFVEADVLRVEPSRMAVLPDEVSEVTRIALQFDLSEMRDGSGREILYALLEWDVAGVSSNERSVYYVHEITASWDQSRLSAGEEALQRDERPVDDWNIEPLDYLRTGGLVRFDVKDLVKRWLATPSENFGVMVATPDVEELAIRNQLGNARLVVFYGFFPGGGR